jgi:hypothetical protein
MANVSKEFRNLIRLLGPTRTLGTHRAPWLPIIAEGKHSYDLECQLTTEAH